MAKYSHTFELKCLYSTAVCNAFRDQIIGKVNVYFLEDDMYVDVYTVNEISWRYIYTNALQNVIEGANATDCAMKILNHYKAYILKKFFRQPIDKTSQK